MPPFLIPILAFIRANWPWLKYATGAIVLLLALWWAYSAIYHKGYDAASAACEARQRAAEAKAAADTAALQSAMADIDTNLTVDMEAINAVRTIYRDKVVYTAVDVYRDRPDCHLPDGLLQQVNAAASGYAAAAAGTGGPAVHPAATAP